MRSLVLVLLAVVLVMAAGFIALRDRQQAQMDRLGLDELRRIYRRYLPPR